MSQPPRTTLEQAESLFDKMTVILATHVHSDHFEHLPVFELLKHNPRATFISSPEAIQQVRAVDRAATRDMAARLIGLDSLKAQRVRAAVVGPATIYTLGFPDGVN